MQPVPSHAICWNSIRRGESVSGKLARSLLLEQKGIAFALFANGGKRAVAGYYECFVRQCENGSVKGLQDLLHGSAGQVGAADGAGEQGVAGDQDFLRRKVNADATFGVAGRVEDGGRMGASLDGVSGIDTLIDFNRAGRCHAHPGSLRVQHFEQGIIVLVEQNGRSGGSAQLHGSAHVIDVGMRDHDLLDLQVMLADDRQQAFDIVTGVDDHGFARGFVADDGAVALERPDGEDFVDHASIVLSSERLVTST